MWHRGFNQWLIRYLYVPLGGNTNKLSVIVTVAFVAFWHDHSINIVFWALTIMLFILPEMIIKKIIRNKYSHLYQKQTFKYLCALIAAAYIYFLVLANIIGFGYGISQLALLWEKAKSQWVQLLWGWLAVASCVILMFYKRFT
jgi:D-alanyl-lipoteichoic acid acyltransferase DltB (MBOAT superfamily)